jgi:outer membrane immunogenic protein
MRRLLVALGLIASISVASAQEYEFPTLRGSESLMPTPPTFTQWRGVYAGGQAGYSSAGVNFGKGVNDLAAFTVRSTVLEPVVANLTTLSKANTNGVSAGGFVGYNTEWEGVILGFEMNYSRMNLSTGASDSLSVIYANDAGAPPGHHFTYDPLTVSGAESIRITDLATFRARAGWIAGQFLPYGFLGVAVARADVARSATVSFTRKDFPDPQPFPNPPITPIPDQPFGPATQADVKNGGFYFGYAAGIGLDVFVMPNIFVRGEWEFVSLPNIKSMSISINSFRTAVGVKF